jgi:hypothetical protein
MSKQSIFDITSYELLAEQKAVLMQLRDKDITKAEHDALAGIINFLDAFQDEAVDMHGKSETEVFTLEEPKQIKCYCGHTTYCDCGPLEEPKQETIEQVAEIFKNDRAAYGNDITYEIGFVDGTKFQAERMYSEEDMKQFGLYLGDNLKKLKNKSIDEIFEQFKNI